MNNKRKVTVEFYYDAAAVRDDDEELTGVEHKIDSLIENFFGERSLEQFVRFRTWSEDVNQFPDNIETAHRLFLKGD